MYQVDGAGDSAAAAAAAAAARAAAQRAAEEAARRAAEEAARRAAEEAARRAAEEDASSLQGSGRYSAYGAPEEAPTAPTPTGETPPAPSTDTPDVPSLVGKVMSFFGFAGTGEVAPTAMPQQSPPEPPAPTEGDPAVPAAVQKEIDRAKEQEVVEKRDNKQRANKPTAAERAERAKVPIEPDQQVVFDALTPQQQQAFRELTPASRQDFSHVYEAVGGLWAEKTEQATDAAQGLGKLLQDGKVEALDTQGDTLIHTLAVRTHDQLQPALQGHNETIGLLQSAIKQVAFPDNVFQGDNTNTCASTALQGILAKEDPAEFMRIATGLAFDGKATFESGATIKLDAHEVGSASDGNRSVLSQALQTSFDTFAKQFPPVSETDFGGGRVGGGGRYGGGRVGGGSRFGDGVVDGSVGGASGGQVDGGGLTPNQIEKLYEKVVGRLAVNVTVDESNRYATMDGIAATLEAGMNVPVGVQGVDDQGNPTHHMINVEGIRQDPKDPNKDLVIFTDPGTGKPASMPVEKFIKLMEVAIIPACHADPLRWNVEPSHGDFGGGRVGGGGRLG